MASAIRSNTNPFISTLIRPSSSSPSSSSFVVNQTKNEVPIKNTRTMLVSRNSRSLTFRRLVCAVERSNTGSSSSSSSDGKKGGGLSNSNYVVPLDKTFPYSNSSITRPLDEILRDLNKKIPDNIIVKGHAHRDDLSASTLIPWYSGLLKFEIYYAYSFFFSFLSNRYLVVHKRPGFVCCGRQDRLLKDLFENILRNLITSINFKTWVFFFFTSYCVDWHILRLNSNGKGGKKQ